MKFLKIRDVKNPQRGTNKSAGIDFFIPNDFEKKVLNPSESINIPSGLKIQLPPNTAFIAFNKSGVALKKGLQVGACVIDEDYQGELHLHVTNVGNKFTVLEPGEKITQFILIPILYESIDFVENEKELFSEKSERGEGGFGHTGTK